MSSSSFSIGGGAINEKERTYTKPGDPQDAADMSVTEGPVGERSSESNGFDPSSLSHALHALAGLDRYPNYLSRWSNEDVDQLEESLERQLQEVRRQKQSIRDRREGINALLGRVAKEDPGGTSTQILTPPTSWEEIRDNVLDPRASGAIFSSKQFKKFPPSVDDVLSGKIQVHLDGAQLEAFIVRAWRPCFSRTKCGIFFLIENKFTGKLKREEIHDATMIY